MGQISWPEILKQLRALFDYVFFRDTVAWCKWFAQRGGAKHPLPRKLPVESMPWKNNKQRDGIVFGEGVKTVFSVLPDIMYHPNVRMQISTL